MKTEKKIVEINSKVQEIISCENLCWEQKYNRIFSDQISRKVHKLIYLDYYDPDTSYKEDVLAFAEALKNYTEQL